MDETPLEYADGRQLPAIISPHALRVKAGYQAREDTLSTEPFTFAYCVNTRQKCLRSLGHARVDSPVDSRSGRGHRHQVVVVRADQAHIIQRLGSFLLQPASAS